MGIKLAGNKYLYLPVWLTSDQPSTHFHGNKGSFGAL